MENSTKKNLATSINFEFGGNGYTINFPNNGQFIEIERLKTKLSDGYYSEMAIGSGNSYYATLLIDTIATFNVLYKDLTKELNKPIYEMSMIEAKPLVDIYKNIYLPWFSEWSVLLSDTSTDVNEE